MSEVSSTPSPSSPAASPAARRPQTLGRDFSLLWGASGSANLADGLVRVVLPLIAVELTRSPALIAGIAVTTTLAWLVVGLPAGALGDRLDRRIIALTIAVLRTVLRERSHSCCSPTTSPSGCCSRRPSCSGWGRPSSTPPPPRWFRAWCHRGTLPGAWASARGVHGRGRAGRSGRGWCPVRTFQGRAAAGVHGVPRTVRAHALAFAHRLRRPSEPEGERTALLTEIRQGLILLVRNRRIFVVALWGGLVNFAGSLTFAVLALYLVAPGPVGLDTWGFGVLMASLGVGGLVGASVAGRLAASVGELRLLTLSCATMAVDSAVLAITTQVWAIAAGLVVGSAAAAVFGVMAITALQRATPTVTCRVCRRATSWS